MNGQRIIISNFIKHKYYVNIFSYVFFMYVLYSKNLNVTAENSDKK